MFFSSSSPSGPFREISRIRMSGRFCAMALHGGVCFFRLAADLHVLLLVDQQRQPLPQQRMIVHDQDRLLRRCARSVQGSSCRAFAYPFTSAWPRSERCR